MDPERALEIQRTAMADWIALFAASSPGAKAFERDGIVAVAVPACPERSIANSVFFREAGALAGALEELAEFFDRAPVDAWTVWVPDFEADAIAALERAGHSFDGKPRAMVLELEGWSGPEIGDLDWGESEDRSVLGRLNDLAYGLTPENGLARALTDPAPGYRIYEARVEGEVACVLGTVDHAPSAGAEGGDLGFYFVATDPAHRGRGLASRLMAALLGDARDRGLETSSLQSSAMGEPVYARLGFEPHFRLHMYERRR